MCFRLQRLQVFCFVHLFFPALVVVFAVQVVAVLQGWCEVFVLLVLRALAAAVFAGQRSVVVGLY